MLPTKKPRLDSDGETASVNTGQLIERRWVKVEESEREKGQQSLKVMQWNSLADGLAHTSFIHCPAEALKWSYRGPMILQEILRSEADIICMEEVDHFHDTLRPKLEEKGFAGLFVEKKDSPCLEFTPNNGPDGCALFYRLSKLQLIKKKELVLDREDGSKSNQVAMVVQLKFAEDDSSTIQAESDQSTPAKTKATKESTAHQTNQEMDDSVKKTEDPQTLSTTISDSTTICIAVTHLKAKKEGVELRAAQGKHLLSEVASFSENHPTIVCGDFNATADEPVYDYFSGGESTLDLKLASSYVTRYYGNKEPPLTSWKFRAAGESKYTIDYIWYTPQSLKVESIWAVPTEEDIGKDGLPSLSYPSDHVSICTGFRL